jgi:hypothetical protein
VGFRPEIFDRIGATEFERNQVIDLVIARTVRRDAIFPVNFAFHFCRNVTHLSAVSGYAEILRCNVECVSRRQPWIGKYWGGLLGEDEGVRNNKKAMVLMNIGNLFPS